MLLGGKAFKEHADNLFASGVTFQEQLKLVTETRDSIEIVHTSEYGRFLENLYPAFIKLLQITTPQFFDTLEQKLRNTVLEILNRLPHTEYLRPYVASLLSVAMRLLETDNEVNAVICLRILFDVQKNFRPTVEDEVTAFSTFVLKTYTRFPEIVKLRLIDPLPSKKLADSNVVLSNAISSSNIITPSVSVPTELQSTGSNSANIHSVSSLSSSAADTSLIDSFSNTPVSSATEPIPKSVDSFKVLMECPLIFMLLFQRYPRLLSSSVEKLSPLMVKGLEIIVQSDLQTSRKELYNDFISAQVKTLSFLIYLIRVGDLIKPYDKQVPAAMINLLRNCPCDGVSIRKELLVATRHITATDFRAGFVNQIDVLLDEYVFIGKGRTCYETLRPLAYSTLADVVHHARDHLTLPLLWKVAFIFCRNIHDATLPLSIQVTSVRILLGLVEFIYHNNGTEGKGRVLLLKMFYVFVKKANSLKRYIAQILDKEHLLVPFPNAPFAADVKDKEEEDRAPIVSSKSLKASSLRAGSPNSTSKCVDINVEAKDSTACVDDVVVKEVRDAIASLRGPLLEDQAALETAVSECRHLLKTLFMGLKTIAWSLNNLRPVNVRGSVPNKGMTETECHMIAGFFSNSLRCLMILFSDDVNFHKAENITKLNKAVVAASVAAEVLPSAVADNIASSDSVNRQKSRERDAKILHEEEEMLKLFAGIFTVLDMNNFQDIMINQLEELLTAVQYYPTLAQIPRFFLENANVSKYFLDVLLGFLFGRLNKLSKPETLEARLILELYKAAFLTLSSFPDNEGIVRLHTRSLVTSCLRYSTETQEPIAFFYVLRALFRAIEGSKFELLYKEFLPLLQELLNSLLKLQNGAHRATMRNLFVELCLTIPAKLSSLLPYLHLLMPSVVYALQSGEGELRNLGLNVLETWIDHLNHEFLDPILSSVVQELMLTLWGLLEPSSSVGPTALKLLGKFGGRNRRFLEMPLPVIFNAQTGRGMRVRMSIPKEKGNTPFKVTLSLEHAITISRSILRKDRWRGKNDLEANSVEVIDGLGEPKHIKMQVFLFFKSCLVPLIGTTDCHTAIQNCLASNTPPPVAFVAELKKRKDTQKIGNVADNSKMGLDNVDVDKIDPMLLDSSNSSSANSSTAAVDSLRVPLELYQVPPAITSSISSFSSNAGGTNGPTPDTPFVSGFDDDTPDAAALESILLALHECAADPILAPTSSSIVDDVARHFAFVFTSSVSITRPPKRRGFRTLDPHIYLNVLESSVCSEDREVSAVGVRAVISFTEFLRTLCTRDGLTYEHPVLELLARRLAHSCYRRDWFFKRGACQAIQGMCKVMSVDWIIRQQVNFIRAALFVMKDLEPETSVLAIDTAADCIDTIIRRCHDAKGVSPDNREVVETERRALVDVVSSLILDINHLSAAVRENVQNALIVLAELQGTTVSRIIDQKTRVFLQKVFKNPLRPLQIRAQIGIIDALGFCLSQQPPLIPIDSDVLARLAETLKLAAEDGAKDARTMGAVQNLRMVTLELMCSAISSPEFRQSELSPEMLKMRNDIISMSFKSLTYKSKKVVNAAKAGLAAVVAQHRLPLEILHDSLRPILKDVSDFRSLTLTLLGGLSRLLELFSNCFNTTLGKKLLEHLERWTDPEKIVASKIWRQGEETKVAGAIVDLFHLLPPSPDYLDDLITVVVRLEALLPVSSCSDDEESSPYRGPITRFCCRYCPEAVEYFIARLDKAPYSRLFLHVLQSEASSPIRDECIRRTDLIVLSALSPSAANLSPSDINEIRVAGIRIVLILTRYKPEWLVDDNRPVLRRLAVIWNESSQRLTGVEKEASDTLAQLKETKLLAKIFITYCKKFREEHPLLFVMVSVFTLRSIADLSFLKEFYLKDVARNYSAQQRRNIMFYFLRAFTSNTFSQSHKAYAFSILIVPMLKDSFRRNMQHEIIDQTLIKRIITDLLEPSEVNQPLGEDLRVELLKFVTLLLEHMSDDLIDHRKELIKFAWSHLKSDDITGKQMAYVNVCRFVNVYETPARIVLQVYVALLRAYQPEGRALVKEALDMLMPALPRRLQPPKEHKYPTWIRWTKKIIVEEGHSLAQLIHVWQLIVRHPELFYSSRAQFIPQMVNSLVRIGLPAAGTLDNRRLALDLVKLIIDWDVQTAELQLQRATGAGNNKSNIDQALKKQKTMASLNPGQSTPLSPSLRPSMSTASISHDGILAPGGTGGTDDTGSFSDADYDLRRTVSGHVPSQFDRDFRPNHMMSEMIVSFLSRVAFITATEPLPSSPSQNLSDACIRLLSSALTTWPEAQIKVEYLERLFKAHGIDNDRNQVTVLEIMNAIIRRRITDDLVSSSYTQQIIKSCITSEDHRVLELLQSYLTRVVAKFVPGSKDGVILSDFYKFLSDCIMNGLSSAERSVNSNAIMILKAVCLSKNTFLDKFATPLLKVIQRLMKEHTQISRKVDPKDTDSSHPGSAMYALRSATMLFSSRVLYLADQKKPFFSVLCQIIEKSTEISLLLDITRVIGTWIIAKDSPVDHKDKDGGNKKSANIIDKDKEGTILTKDKIQFLVKMVCFEDIPSPVLHAAFLNIVHRLYSDPSNEHSELLVKIERAFMIGLRCSTPDIRYKFFMLFDKNLSKVLYRRLHYVLDYLNWVNLRDSFWIKQGLELLMSIIRGKDPVELAHNSGTLTTITSSLSTSQQGVSEVCSPGISALLHAHQNFLRTDLMSIKTSLLLSSLVSLSHESTVMAFHLWTMIFPAFWAHASPEEQKDLTKMIIALLTQDFLLRQQSEKVNVVQALLQGFFMCKPVPKIPPIILLNLGKMFSCWVTSIMYLEEYLRSMPEQSDIVWHIYKPLSELYRLTSEEDLLYGIWKTRFSGTDETRNGIAYEQFGDWQRAQEQYYSLMTKIFQGTVDQITEDETRLIEDRWVHCATLMHQWDVLTEFAKTVKSVEMLVDCVWKLPDWNSLKKLLTEYPKSESAVTKVYQIYVAIQDGKIGETEKLCNEAVSLALQQWHALPLKAVSSRIVMLQLFQQLVELQESAQIVVEVNNMTRGGAERVAAAAAAAGLNAFPEIKQVLHAWRERLPNRWDSINVWNDIVTWRNHIFVFMTQATLSTPGDGSNSAPNQNSSPSPLGNLGAQETVGNLIRFSRIARQHGLSLVCQNMLMQLFRFSPIETSDYFARAMEQIKSFLKDSTGEESSANELNSGLSMCMNTTVEYYNPSQKAELLLLKGIFLSRIGESKRDDANAAFSSAVSQSDSFGKAWLYWGEFCDRIVYESSRDIAWADNAMTCYLQGLKHSPDRSRLVAARVFWLLSQDVDSRLSKTFDKLGEQTHSWIWVMWIPQLLNALEGIGGDAASVFKVIVKLAKAYPQQLYCGICAWRSMNTLRQDGIDALKEREDVAKANSDGDGTTNGSVPLSVKSLCVLIDEILTILRDSNKVLVSEMELLFSEMTRRFSPDAIEVMVEAVEHWLDACYSEIPTLDDRVPLQISDEVKRICETITIENLPDHARREREAFANDFSWPSSTLSELLVRLKRWQLILKDRLKTMPRFFRLEDIAPNLLQLRNTHMTIPQQNHKEYEMIHHQHIRLDRLEADVERIRLRRGRQFARRRLIMRGSDGRKYPFCLYEQQASTLRQEDRMMQFRCAVNVQLRWWRDTRRRQMSLPSPACMHFSPQSRMVQDLGDCISLWQIYERWCESESKDVDAPLVIYRDTMSSVLNAGTSNGSSRGQAMIKAYQEIVNSHIPDDILLRFFISSMPSYDELFAFKQRFIRSFAVTSVYVYVVAGQDLSPGSLNISRGTGEIFASPLRTTYLDDGRLMSGARIPWRLSRNLVKVMTPFGFLGTYVTALSCTARALSPKRSAFANVLSLVIQDDMRLAPQMKKEVTVESVAINVGLVVDRIQGLCPVRPERLTERANKQSENSKESGSETAPKEDASNVSKEIAKQPNSAVTPGPATAPFSGPAVGSVSGSTAAAAVTTAAVGGAGAAPTAPTTTPITVAAPTPMSNPTSAGPRPLVFKGKVDSRLTELMKAASNEIPLSQLPATWHPWL